jgi:hypothetical protein
MVRLTTYLDLESLEIRRSGFGFKSNLTSAIGNLAKLRHLASYVSRLNAMAYDILAMLAPSVCLCCRCNGVLFILVVLALS